MKSVINKKLKFEYHLVKYKRFIYAVLIVLLFYVTKYLYTYLYDTMLFYILSQCHDTILY